MSAREVVVGDFFRESWGYDQTNVDFYQVVRISTSGKTAWLRQVRAMSLSEPASGSEQISPLPGEFYDLGRHEGRELKRLVKFSKWDGENRPYVNMTSYSSAYLWDCKPAYQTASGWGH